LYLFGLLLLWFFLSCFQRLLGTSSVLKAPRCPTIQWLSLQQLLLLLVLRLYQLSKVISSAGLLVLVASKVAVCFVRTSAAILADAILVA
jgi:hypothetical protein